MTVDRSLGSALHRWRLRRAKLRLADVEYDLRKWGFGYTPSEIDRRERKIEKLRRKVADLGG